MIKISVENRNIYQLRNENAEKACLIFENSTLKLISIINTFGY